MQSALVQHRCKYYGEIHYTAAMVWVCKPEGQKGWLKETIRGLKVHTASVKIVHQMSTIPLTWNRSCLLRRPDPAWQSKRTRLRKPIHARYTRSIFARAHTTAGFDEPSTLVVDRSPFRVWKSSRTVNHYIEPLLSFLALTIIKRR
jgi:hypothetical protein